MTSSPHEPAGQTTAGGVRPVARLALRPVARLALRLGVAVAVAGAFALPAVLLLLLVEGAWEPLERLDVGVADALHGAVLGDPVQTRVWLTVAVLLHPNTFRLAVLVACVALWRRGARRTAVWAGVTMAGGGLLGWVVKLVVERARPTFPDPVTTVGGYSFPSLHALNALLGCGVLLAVAWPRLRGRRRALAGAVAVALVLVTAVDRLALGVHYVSDVVAGWSVALAVLGATTVASGRRRTPRRG